MRNQADIYYQAVLARDPRFDGKFFVGVKTTGIYCRPICPARPKKENVEFLPNALAAEKAGYRPCMRCRPECAPMSPAWIGKSALVQRALKLVTSNGYLDVNEDSFADQLGVSARHLRRLIQEELGKTPKQIFMENRLNFSRKLVVETYLPITEIAMTSGFSSIRRFNDAFKNRFHRPPSEFRRSKGGHEDGKSLELTVSYRPPFDWASMIHFYQSHGIAYVENVIADSYERVFKLNDSIGAVQAFHNSENSRINLKIVTSEPRSLYQVVQNIRQMFDLDSDPVFIENHFASCPVLSKITRKFPGLRLHRGWDAYETSICTILGQLVSVEQARRFVRQLVETYGEEVQNPLNNRKSRLFPSPIVLSRESLSELKTTPARKDAIREFSRLVASGKIKLGHTQDPSVFRGQLLSIKGIGAWTAEYIALRAIGDVDSFPATDLILKRALQENPKIKIENHRPWRAYAAIYLWKEFANTLSKKKVRQL